MQVSAGCPCGDLSGDTREGWPGVRVTRERLVLQETEQRCQLPRSRTCKRPERRTGLAVDAGSVRQVQPEGSGSGAVSVRDTCCSASRPRHNDGDHRVSPLPRALPSEPPQRLQNIAGVAGLHPSLTRETPPLGGACATAFAPLVCRKPSSSPHTTWREAVARTHRVVRARRYCTAQAGSDVRAHTTVGAPFKGMPSRDDGSEPT